ncbi:MaoC/PaaZ C-terminal domain-containing protein [Natronorubrum sp. FCH18a]|uniref:MaoC/PaaZ C-terminal domain-containing protein n=1 Tax=Natronorubrum sp. FCH18a TaxID=3447018 RepID=UPI003F517410
MTRYYEDLAVGDVYETGSYTVTKEEIVDFAEQFDLKPFHVDEEAAAESIFGELVASGLHTLCLSVRLFSRTSSRVRRESRTWADSEWTTCGGTSRSDPMIRSAFEPRC